MARLFNDNSGEFVNESERKVVEKLLEELPEDHLIIPNVVFHQPNGSVDEVDVLVIGPRWITVVETKTYNRCRVIIGPHHNQHKVNGQIRSNPVVTTKNKTDRLVSRFAELPFRQRPWLSSQVVIAGDPEELHLDSNVAHRVTRIQFASDRIQNQEHMVPSSHFPPPVNEEECLKLLKFHPRKIVSEQFGQYRILREIEQSETYSLYSAEHVLSNVEQYLRVYKVDPALTSATQKQQNHVALQAFLSVSKIDEIVGWKPEIVGPVDAGKTDSGDVFIVLPVPYGPPLDEFLDGLKKEDPPLYIDAGASLLIIRDIANAIKAAHAAGISHRALSTSTIFVNPSSTETSGPRAKLGSWDKAFLEQISTGQTVVLDASSAKFFPPEILGDMEFPSENLQNNWELVDLYALGVCIQDIWDCVDAAMPPLLSDLVVVLCANNPDDRDVSAAEVVEKVEELLAQADTEVEADTLQDPNELLDGRYQIIQMLGTGTSGEVFEAFDTLASAHVALKKFRSGFSIAHAQREFGALMTMTHQNIVRVFDIKEIENRIYLKMERLTGKSLKKQLSDEGPVELGLATEWFINLLDALKKLHSSDPTGERVFVHRDIKPENLVLENQQRGIVLVDFGIASSSDNEVAGGTGRYRSVDYGVAESVPAMDLFSLAVVFHEIVTGEHPFGDKPNCYGEPTISQDLPNPVKDWLEKALSSEPEKRFTNAEEMSSHLNKATSREDVPSEESEPAETTPEETEPPPESVSFKKGRLVGALFGERARGKAGDIISLGPKVKLRVLPSKEFRTVPQAPSGEQDVRVKVIKAEIFANPSIQLDVELLVTDYGESWIHAVDAHDSPRYIHRLVHGLRPGIYDVPGKEQQSFIELRQAQIVDDPAWPKIRKVSLKELNDHAEVDVSELFGLHGALTVDTRENAYGETNNRKTDLCVTFNKTNTIIPLAAYVLTRVAPLTAEEAPPDSECIEEPLDMDSLPFPDLNTPMSKGGGGYGDTYLNGYEYFACHENNPWRKPVAPFQSLRTALFGNSGALNLFAAKGKLAHHVARHGPVKMVIVRLQDQAILTDGKDMVCVPWVNIEDQNQQEIESVFHLTEKLPCSEDSFNK
tara:strand:- start:258 stop:3569 length:3312 start_codon:yes stop_codon:yes gene_type:complete